MLTDLEIQARRPYIVVVVRKESKCIIIDAVVLDDAGITEKEREQIEKYHDLRRELRISRYV